MTDNEILRSYNEAKDPAKQVQVLADLNACSTDDIKKVLVSQGIDGRRLPRKKPAQQKPGKPARSMSILQIIDREIVNLRERREEIDIMIPRLRDEQESINEKINALKTAQGVLKKAYEEKA